MHGGSFQPSLKGSAVPPPPLLSLACMEESPQNAPKPGLSCKKASGKEFVEEVGYP